MFKEVWMKNTTKDYRPKYVTYYNTWKDLHYQVEKKQ